MKLRLLRLFLGFSALAWGVSFYFRKPLPIRVYPCPSVVKTFFYWMDLAQSLAIFASNAVVERPGTPGRITTLPPRRSTSRRSS